MQLIPFAIAALGTVIQGEAADRNSKIEGAQLQQQAGQSRAEGQLRAVQERRSARYVQSRALAVAAASGAGASDPTVVNLISDIAGEGEFRALTSLYEGESAGNKMEYGAKIRRREGKAAATSSALNAAGTLLSGSSSWAAKYGGGGPLSSPRYG